MELGFPRRGCVYWARLPDERKSRPAIVMSLDVRNRLANDVIVVPLSSVLRTAPTHVLLGAGEGGLPRRSVAKCELVTTVSRERLSANPIGGTLSPARLHELERAILRAIGVPIGEPA